MSSRSVMISVVVLAAILRLGIVVATGPHRADGDLLPDERQYWDLARGLATGDGLRDELGFRAAHMPLYPAFLAPFTGLAWGRGWALAVQALLSSAVAGCVAALAERIARGSLGLAETPARRVALLAGLLTACDPFLVYFCRYLLTENLFAAALAAAVCCGWPAGDRPSGWRRFTTALLWALCVYLRPSAAGLALLWAAGLAWRGGLSRRGVLEPLALLAVIAATLLPWALRNQRVTGHRTWLTNRLGISLYDGLGPQATGASDLGPIKAAPELRGLDETQWNRHFLQAAWRSARHDPGHVLRLAGTKLGRTWRPWPAAPGHEALRFKVLGGAWSGLLLLAALAGAVALRRRPGVLLGLLLPALYFSALHAVFVGSLRYRLPAMPLIEVLAAAGIVVYCVRSWHCPSTTKP